MRKEEIIQKIESLSWKIKTPGRAYTKDQRELMKTELSKCKLELDKITLEEDIAYIIDFAIKYPDYLIPQRDALKKQIEDIASNVNDSRLIYVLKNRLRSFQSDLDFFNYYEQSVRELMNALDYIQRNQAIPHTNKNYDKSKDEIQKSLAKCHRAAEAALQKRETDLNKIKRIIRFFEEENEITGFVLLSNAIFNEASNFENGFAKVEKGSKKIYFTFEGREYSIESNEFSIPKTEKLRENPDLHPFKTVSDDPFKTLMGYKNSDNKIIIAAKYKHASPFVNGFAKVETEKKFGKKVYTNHGLIDGSGNLVLHFDNPFYEIENSFNDIVKYKRHIYGPDSYERISSLSFDVEQRSNYLGLHSGYLIYKKIKPYLFEEIDKILQLEKILPDPKTNDEVERMRNKIKCHNDNINFCLAYVTGE